MCRELVPRVCHVEEPKSWADNAKVLDSQATEPFSAPVLRSVLCGAVMFIYNLDAMKRHSVCLHHSNRYPSRIYFSCVPPVFRPLCNLHIFLCSLSDFLTSDTYFMFCILVHPGFMHSNRHVYRIKEFTCRCNVLPCVPDRCDLFYHVMFARFTCCYIIFCIARGCVFLR
jgi:hypothetical protein